MWMLRMMWAWMLQWVLTVLDGALTCAALRRSQMIYFVLTVSVLGQAAQNGALLQLTGEAAKVEFGGALTLIHNSTEDELVCSGKIRASDVVIEGTSTTVAEIVADHAAMKADIAALKQFVGMMPPPPISPPASPPVFGEPLTGGCRDAAGADITETAVSEGTMVMETLLLASPFAFKILPVLPSSSSLVMAVAIM